MTGIDLYLNISYIAYVVAPAIKNELWLRSLLMANAIAFAVWGVLIDNGSVIFWNTVFAAISLFGIIRLLRERRAVTLTQELETIRQNLFPSVSNRDFLLFWSLGETIRDHTGLLTTEGSTVDRLFLLINGEAKVQTNGSEVARLATNQFVGEMAFVTGQPASATVALDGPADVHSWAFSDLETLKTLEPQLVTPLLSTVNRDLAEKLRT
jgi:CRP-like cAMP-binding protein